jgi:4-diphosphocytidyl-2-C-methyl-D-erythritol kinase
VSARVRVRAPAKVNLTLEVLGRRADGYHELATLMATVDLRDDVRVARALDLEVAIRPDVGAPRGDDLATRAVRAFADATGRDAAAHVVVRKRIPVAAGLGGGSSDAGAVLRALAHLSRDLDLDLARVGANVGSDVPFFALGCGLGRVSGRGETVEALPSPAEPLWITLVTFAARLRTADVFARAGEPRSGAGDATKELSRLAAGGALAPRSVRELARNDLSSPAGDAVPLIRDAIDAAASKGIALVLSGSGPSLFAVADDRAHAIRDARVLRRLGLRAAPRALCVEAPVTRV